MRTNTVTARSTDPLFANATAADRTEKAGNTSRPVFISTIPVLIPTREAKPQGYALCGLRPTPVRVMTDRDVGALYLGLEKTPRDELIAVANLAKAYRDRNRESARKTDWKMAVRNYKLSLAFQRKLHESGRRREDNQAELELGRWLIANQENAGIDLGTKSPKKAASIYSGYALPQNSQRDPLSMLGRAIHRHLQFAIANLVLWRRMDGEPQLGLLCRQREEALYILALLRLPEPKGLAVCLYPRCKQVVFEQSRPDQDYCSPAHREADRVARWRMTPKGRRAMKRDSKRRKQRVDRARKSKNTRRSKKSKRATIPRVPPV